MARIRFSFHRDKDNGEIHCWNRHLVEPKEAIEAWFLGVANESPAHGGALFRWAQLKSGRTIRVVWRWLKVNSEVFIITAYDYEDKETTASTEDINHD